MLDSNLVIPYLADDSATVPLVERLAPEGIAISIITDMEVDQGTLRSREPERAQEQYDGLKRTNRQRNLAKEDVTAPVRIVDSWSRLVGSAVLVEHELGDVCVARIIHGAGGPRPQGSAGGAAVDLGDTMGGAARIAGCPCRTVLS